MRFFENRLKSDGRKRIFFIDLLCRNCEIGAMGIVRILAILMLVTSSVSAEGFHRFSVGAGVGYATLSGGSPPWYTLAPAFSGKLGTHLKGRWNLELGFASFKIYDDTSAHSEFKFGSDENDRQKAWKGYDLTLLFKRRFSPEGSRLSACGGIGGGISTWKVLDAKADTVLKTVGERGETTDFATTEIILTMNAGLEYQVHRNLRLEFDFYANRFTGAGREFDDAVEKNISPWNLRAGVYLSYLFGKVGWESKWNEGRSQQTAPQPASGKGLTSPELATTPKTGSVDDDSDGDGILDVKDHCPRTPPEAYGMVDIRGCPVDSDCDGVPDYLDNCPDNPLGALVDENGCPLDSDNDGIPDGLDDCPNSDPDLAVDQSGCVDLSPLEIQIILNIKYQSGSFEIDRSTQEKLDELSRILLKAIRVRVEINGYTDNIGTTQANRILSQKRANRVRDYLVRLGIESERLMPIGRGEANFIASNATRKGRQTNRRVELIFFR